MILLVVEKEKMDEARLSNRYGWRKKWDEMTPVPVEAEKNIKPVTENQELRAKLKSLKVYCSAERSPAEVLKLPESMGGAIYFRSIPEPPLRLLHLQDFPL